MKTVTTGGTENGQKRRRHDRYDSAQGKAQEEPEPSHNLQENSYARFLQLDKTTMRRNSRCKVRANSDRHQEG